MAHWWRSPFFLYLYRKSKKMRINSLFVGGSGVAVSEVVASAELPASFDVSEIIKVVVQVVIGIATLIGLFKKDKKKDTTTLNN